MHSSIKHNRSVVLGLLLAVSTSLYAQSALQDSSRVAPQRSASQVQNKQQKSANDTLDTDTMRVITVRPHSVRMPFTNGTKQDLESIKNSEKFSLNGILKRIAPVVHDYILHPFGFAERKRNKKRKKVQKILQQYDAIGASDPLQLLLDSVAIELQKKDEAK